MSTAELDYDPVAVVASVAKLVYQEAINYATRRRRPDLKEELAQALMAELLEQAWKGNYRPDLGRPTTWAKLVIKSRRLLHFNAIAYPVRVPFYAAQKALKAARSQDDRDPLKDHPVVRAVQVAWSAPDLPEYLGNIPERERTEDTHREAMIDRLRAAITRLPKRDREIVIEHFGLDGKEPQTYRAIARKHGITRSAVQAVGSRGVKKLRKLIQEIDG